MWAKPGQGSIDLKFGIMTHVDLILGWRDRLRLLFGWCLTIKVFTRTAFRPGCSESQLDVLVWRARALPGGTGLSPGNGWVCGGSRSSGPVTFAFGVGRMRMVADRSDAPPRFLVLLYVLVHLAVLAGAWAPFVWMWGRARRALA